MEFLTTDQHNQIKTSLKNIISDANELLANPNLSDNELKFFYTELKIKVDYATTFMNAADLFVQMEKDKNLNFGK